MDKRGRDQFLMQHDRQHKVCWNDPKKGCAEVFFAKSAPTEWSPLPLIFSPLGTYVCSLHPPLGAALWVSRSNEAFERVMRFPSPNVQKADFSAHEEFLTLYSVVPKRSGAPDIVMSVFDVRSGRKLRSIQVMLHLISLVFITLTIPLTPSSQTCSYAQQQQNTSVILRWILTCLPL